MSRFELALHLDEHGFNAHCTSQSHNRNMEDFARDPTMFMEKHSKEFHSDFMSLLSSRYANKRVDSNLVYQEFITDSEHVHLNSTNWTSLTAYVHHIGREGLAKIEEEQGTWFITYIDRSRATTNKIEGVRKRAILERTEEERDRKSLADQVAKAEEVRKVKDREKAEGEPQSISIETTGKVGPMKMAFKISKMKQPLKITKLSSLVKKK